MIIVFEFLTASATSEAFTEGNNAATTCDFAVVADYTQGMLPMSCPSAPAPKLAREKLMCYIGETKVDIAI